MEKQDTCQEAMAAFQAGDDSSWEQDGRWRERAVVGFWEILKIEPTRFPKGLDEV